MFDNQKIESQQLFQIKIFRNITFDFLLKKGDSSRNDSKPVSMTSGEHHLLDHPGWMFRLDVISENVISGRFLILW